MDARLPGEISRRVRRSISWTLTGMRTCCIYDVRMPSSSSAAPAPEKPSVKQPPAADRVYTHVKQGVLERRYEGGTLLTEGELAEAVGVSRTPVREALLRLEV